VALIVVDDSGENSIVVASGANARLMPEHVEAAAVSIREARVLLLQLEVPLATVRRAAEIARQGGARVILNPAPAQPLSDEMLALVDILIPNESETALLTGLPVDELADAGAAASSLHASGIGAVILTLGERGALLSQDGETRLFPAFAVERVVDTTAAGDAFVGGLATAVATGKSLPEAVTWGNAAGALAVTQVGAQPSLPYLVQLETVLQRANEAQRQGVLL
jgi:ribokinase